MNYLKVIFITLLFSSCGSSDDTLTEAEFQELMNNIAEGWSTQIFSLPLAAFMKMPFTWSHPTSSTTVGMNS
ncbi:MAG: hypothetical protein RJQ09_20235 [Cyclobacteriaceae bacterium]